MARYGWNAAVWLTVLCNVALAAPAVHPLLESAELPAGFRVKKVELKAKGKVIGEKVVVSSPKTDAKVVIVIKSDVNYSTPEARRSQAKAFIDECTQEFANRKFAVSYERPPDIDQANFAGQVLSPFAFMNNEGKQVFAHQHIFFSDKAFEATVRTDDHRMLSLLDEWADTLKPAAPPADKK